MDRNWTKEEIMVAFNVYCKIPFKASNKTHPMIVKYANIIGRSPSALNMKIGNLGRLDPKLKAKNIVGLTHGSKLEKDIWDEFYADPDKLVYESECLIAKFSHEPLEKASNIDTSNLPEGKERISVIKQRVNQSFFRSAVMSSYDFRCCISGVCNPELLDACHIIDWATGISNRTNPENGLCLNSLFHRAYDKHLIAITPDFEIIISDEMIDKASDESFRNYLSKLNGRNIYMPNKFFPNQNFLDSHYQEYLKHG